MKKLIFSVLLIAIASSVKAQSVDTTSASPYAVVKITTPFVTSWQDTTKARYLHVTAQDNLKDAAMFRWVLFGAGTKPLQQGDELCDGVDYKNWDGSNIFPFVYVADKLGITIK